LVSHCWGVLSTRELPSKDPLRGAGSVMQQEALEHQGSLRRLEGANHRFLGEARLGITIAAMVMILIDPSGPAPYAQFGVLLPYGAYSAVLMVQGRDEGAGTGLRYAHWVDAACFLLVVGLSGGITNKWSLFLLFPVLGASLQSGLRQGIIAAVACALLLACVGALRAWLDPGVRFRDVSLWPVAALLLIGLLVARWGNAEFTLRRRLAFLNDLNTLASPRHNLDHAMRALSEMLRAFHRADSCIAVIADGQSDDYLLWEANAEPRETRMHGERISIELTEPLLGSSPELAMMYSRRRRFWQRTVVGTYDRMSLEIRPSDRAALEQLANLLETDSFITVPVYFRHRPIGRLYATSRRLRYVEPDLRFLQQVIGQAALVVENIQLLDRLASEVATHERRRISRDLHDGTIQPYIGLKLGLEALRRQVPDDTSLAVEVDDLARMAGEGIAELRRYVVSLREQGPRTARESLLVAVRRQAEKFTEFYGIDVQVVADSDVRLKEAMFHEVMNIVREGLANIRRHTSAQRALVNLRDEGARLVVEFINDRAPDRNAQVFFPRSLNERAMELGGRVDVEHRDDGRTKVAVAIPV
jgi:signal transduction histidine kinase